MSENEELIGSVIAEYKKLSEYLPNIIDDLIATENRIFTRSMLEKIFFENRESWGLNKKISVKFFIEVLENSGKLKEASFKFKSRKETRYILGDVSPFELALSLKPTAYLTHRGAMYIHDLIDEAPDVLYINIEQTKEHPRNSHLTQEGIDRAFRNKPRISNETAKWQGLNVCVLHGQKTGGLGVINISGENNEKIAVTDLERTLVDVVVRPIYAGGASEILKAYRNAKGKVDVEKLVHTLTEMNYVYPFHQSIGFYLERSGVYDESELEPLREIPIEFDFYLENRMEDPEYSKSWRLYIPKGL